MAINTDETAVSSAFVLKHFMIEMSLFTFKFFMILIFCTNCPAAQTVAVKRTVRGDGLLDKELFNIHLTDRRGFEINIVIQTQI